MKFTLIICTYKRARPLLQLLHSVSKQSLYPNEILIVDGSPDDETPTMLAAKEFQSLIYYKVPPEDRGLTRQRNYGIARVASLSEIVCFLDDDTVLEPRYFEELLKTYASHPEALGVGGYIANEVVWARVAEDYTPKITEFFYDGWKRTEGSRFILRKKLGLNSDCKPGCLPEFSHGRSVSFLPPSGKTYEVEQLMGGVSSFRKKVFETLQFSTYFEGYGLYEDADFSLRVAKQGKLFINTCAQLSHYHHPSGRPNQYKYGKMVVRNGWYVWRTKNPQPEFKDQIKWHCITILLTLIRFSNIFTSAKKTEALTEALGRTLGWSSLWFNKPK